MASAGGEPADRAGETAGRGWRLDMPGPRRRSPGRSGWQVTITASAPRNGRPAPPTGRDKPDDQATAHERIEISPDAKIAVCCSGGGVRSAAFNLGVLQALQSKPEILDRVTTVTAVAGGSYIAAAHALVTAKSPGAGAKELDPPAYALQSPEEQHLRDHTRYMLETWQLAVRCLAVALRGVVINALLVGSLLFISGLLGGWLLRLPMVGIINGLQTAHPRVDLHWWWLIPAVAMVITLGLAWLQAVLPGHSAKNGPWLWHKLSGALPDRTASTSSRLFLIIALCTAFLLVLAPYAIKGLYAVSLSDGDWSVITRFLGFANGTGCRNAVMHHAVCGVPANHPDAAASNGQNASTWHVKFATFATFAAAVVALARATMGRLRTFQVDLSKSGGSVSRLASRAGTFLRERLVPWTGSALLLATMTVVMLRWISVGATLPLLILPPQMSDWGSLAAQCGYAALIIVLIKITTDINAVAMHRFYRDRLAAVYGVVRGKHRDDPPEPDGLAKLSDVRGTRPELVICAAANRQPEGKTTRPGRGCVSFTFTPTSVGFSAPAEPGERPPGEARPQDSSRNHSRTRRTRRDPAGNRVAPGASPEQNGAKPAAGRQAPVEYVDTSYYEDVAGLTLFDAVAASGAAVSPVIGAMTKPAMRMLMAASNMRLGIWLPDPCSVQARKDNDNAGQPAGHGKPAGAADASRGFRRVLGWPRRGWDKAIQHWHQPDILHLLAEVTGSLHTRNWLYITDGGHYENLGLVEALRRKPDHLIVIDAAGDAPGQFTTLGQAISMARSEVGVQVSIDPAGLAPVRTGRRRGAGRPAGTTRRNSGGQRNGTGLQCRVPYATGTFKYPHDDPPGPHRLIYLKLAVPAGAPQDIIAYQQKHSTFPTGSTLQQLYDFQEFDAYRELGHFCAQAAIDDIVLQDASRPPGVPRRAR
jgi:hypothetical protein